MDTIVDRFGEAVAQRGFGQIPNYLLYINQFLADDKRLTPIELLVLIQLVASWWKKDELPFPSMRTLAERIGASERQIHRAISRLEKDNFLLRVKRKSKGIIEANAYDLSPLVSILDYISSKFKNAYPRQSTTKVDPVNIVKE